MVKLGTYLNIVDNSGARQVYCFHLLKKKTSKKASSSIGDIIKGSVKKHKPHRKVKKKDIVRVLIITSKKKIQQLDGQFWSYKKTLGIVLASHKKIPLGNRIRYRISSFFYKPIEKKKWGRLRSVSLGKH